MKKRLRKKKFKKNIIGIAIAETEMIIKNDMRTSKILNTDKARNLLDSISSLESDDDNKSDK